MSNQNQYDVLYEKKDFAGVVKYGKKCLFAYPNFAKLNEGDKTRVQAHLMVVADAYFSMKDYEGGIKWLVYSLHKCPDLLKTQAQAFDSFTALSAKDWHWSWLRLKTELDPESPYQSMSILDISEKTFSDPALVLRKELNCYFCGKQALLEEIIIAGEGLEENAIHFTDKALGVLAQGIGFWWGDAEQEAAATVLVKRSLKILEDGAEEREKSKSRVQHGIISLVNSLASVWHAFCLLKNYHDRADKDFEFVHNLDKKAAPDKYKGVETTGRIVPGITSLTIYNEVQVANLFIEGINILYAIVQYEESLAKAWIDHVGPALVVVTVRLLAHRVAMLGDTYNSIRVWHVAFTLAKWYKLRRLIMLSGSELVRLIPNVSTSILKTLEETCTYVITRWPDSSLAKAHILRLDLAKAIACLQNREYGKGLKHLKTLFDYKSSITDGNGNVDAISHLTSESILVLAQYKALECSHNLKIDIGSAHSKLVEMSPHAIALKACKTLCGLSRNCSVRQGGWQDLAHNYHVMQTITEAHPVTVLLMKDSGRLRDARLFPGDFIYIAQQSCLISRTLQVLIPIIEIELSMKAFDPAQRKIECVLKLIESYKKGAADDEEEDLPRTGSTNFYDQLGSLGMNFEPGDLKKVSYEWQLPEANVPERYVWSEKRFNRTKEFQWLPSQRITVPKYLLHSLDCCCYLCRHPFVSALTIKFLQIQAHYACNVERPNTSLSILYCAKYYFVRAIARVASQYFSLRTELQAAMNPDSVKAVIGQAHTHFFFSTALHWTTTFMEITPFEDIELIIKHYNSALEGIKIYDPANEFLQLVPLEILGTALFSYLSKQNSNFVRGSDFRESYRAYAITCPEIIVLDSDDDDLNSNKNGIVRSESVEVIPCTPPEQQAPKTPVVAPAPAPKKRGRPPKQKK